MGVRTEYGAICAEIAGERDPWGRTFAIGWRLALLVLAVIALIFGVWL